MLKYDIVMVVVVVDMMIYFDDVIITQIHIAIYWTLMYFDYTAKQKNNNNFNKHVIVQRHTGKSLHA